MELTYLKAVRISLATKFLQKLKLVQAIESAQSSKGDFGNDAILPLRGELSRDRLKQFFLENIKDLFDVASNVMKHESNETSVEFVLALSRKTHSHDAGRLPSVIEIDPSFATISVLNLRPAIFTAQVLENHSLFDDIDFAVLWTRARIQNRFVHEDDQAVHFETEIFSCHPIGEIVDGLNFEPGALFFPCPLQR